MLLRDLNGFNCFDYIKKAYFEPIRSELVNRENMKYYLEAGGINDGTLFKINDDLNSVQDAGSSKKEKRKMSKSRIS